MSKDNFSGSGCIFSNSPSVGVRRSKAKRGQDECCYSFFLFFLFFLLRQRHFRKDKTHKTHILQHIHLSYTTQNQHFFPSFFVKLMWWTGLHLFFISRFFFWPFVLTFNWWQWLEGHSFGLVLGIFVFVLNYSDLFGFIRSSRQAWLGESWQKLCRKSRQIGLSLCPKRGRFGPCLRYKPEKY